MIVILALVTALLCLTKYFSLLNDTFILFFYDTGYNNHCRICRNCWNLEKSEIHPPKDKIISVIYTHTHMPAPSC